MSTRWSSASRGSERGTGSAKIVSGPRRCRARPSFESRPSRTSCASQSETGDLRGEELAYLPVTLGEKLVRLSHIFDIDRCTRADATRLEDRHAFGSAVRTHDHDAAPPGGPLDLAHEATA